MSRPRLLALPAFAGWSLFVWATRIDNIWSDADLDTAAKAGRTLLALSFVLAGAAVAVVAVRAYRDRAGPVDRRVVQAAALWTLVVWVVRTVGIVAADHDLAFTVVHVVLAVISAALALLAWRALPEPSDTSGSAPAHVVSG